MVTNNTRYFSIIAIKSVLSSLNCAKGIPFDQRQPGLIKKLKTFFLLWPSTKWKIKKTVKLIKINNTKKQQCNKL